MSSLLKVNLSVIRVPLPILSVFGGGSGSCFSTTACRAKRKIHRRHILEKKHPYDHRFHISPSDVSPGKPHGSLELQKKLAEGYGKPQLPGYKDELGRYHRVPEMVPEFVVPDLEGFELKPYVSFKVPIRETPEFTSEDLFTATYGKDIVQKYRSGELPDPETYFTQKPSED